MINQVNSYRQSFCNYFSSNALTSYLPSKKTINKVYKKYKEKVFSHIPKTKTDVLKFIPYIGSIAGPIIERNTNLDESKFIISKPSVKRRIKGKIRENEKSIEMGKKIKAIHTEKQINAEKECKKQNIICAGKIVINVTSQVATSLVTSFMPGVGLAVIAGAKAVVKGTAELMKATLTNNFVNKEKQQKVWQAGVTSASLSLGGDYAKQVYKETLEVSVQTVALETIRMAKDNCTIL